MLARAAGGCGGGLPSILLLLLLSLHTPIHPPLTLAIPVCVSGGYTCVYPKTRGRVLAKTNPRERKSGRGLWGYREVVKREFARESPGILSRCQRVAGPSAFCFGPETDQRINNEPDILIRRGKCPRASRKNVFISATRLCPLHGDGSGVLSR